MIFGGVHSGGDDGIRTHDPLLAGQVLSQLSYTPVRGGGFWQTASDADPLISPRRCTSYSERTRSRGEKALESRWKKSEGFYPLSSFLKRTVFQLFFPYFSRFLLRVESGSPSVGADLSSRAVTGKVFSALRSLTSVFGMGTGGPSGMRYRLSETTVPEN